MSEMTIGTAARAAGVGVETIRFYERNGLIEQPPKPARGGFRVYPEDTVKRVRFIHQGQALGFSLRQIAELMSLKADPETDCSDVRRRAQAKLEEVNEKLARLTGIRAALEELITACPGRGALRACSIMGALEDAEGAPMSPRQKEEKTL